MNKKTFTAAAVAVAVVCVAVPAAYGTAASAAAKPSLPVTFSADGNGTAGFDRAGNIALTLGSTGTFAQVTVAKAALGTAPATPPSFTTDAYAAGSPRWVIELANGQFVDGYPAQLGAAAKPDFTGSQWAVGNSGTYETYAQALAGAGDPLGNVAVTDAFVVMDADQAPGTSTVTDLQYDGLTAVPAPAPVTEVLSHGHVVSVNNTRAVVAWSVTPDKASGYAVTIHGPGALNGRTGVVRIPQASYSGMEAGHTYSVTVQALAGGLPSGKPGTVTVITTRGRA